MGIEKSRWKKSVAEREVLLDAVNVGRMHRGGAAQIAAALRAFGLGQVAFARARAHYFAAGRDLESFGHGLFGLNAFWTSHKSMFFQKERAI
jgi:hypothetical protein